MNKKIFTLFLGYFFLLLVASLSSCDDDCDDAFNSSYYQVIEKFNWGIYEGQFTNLSDLTLNPLKDKSASHDNFAIHITPVSINVPTTRQKDNFFSIISTAYACSPPSITIDDQITNIEIFSDLPYRSDLQTDTDLIDYFDVVVDHSYEVRLKKYLEHNQDAIREITLFLNKAPSVTKTYSFTVKIYLKGGGINLYEITTDPIQIRI